MPKYGWIKDIPNPHALYYTHWAKHEGVQLKLLDHIDLRRYTDPLGVPWDQGGKGACTAFALSANLSARAVEQGTWSKLGQRFSPEWIYDGERDIEGTLDEDSGAMPEDGFVWIERHGCLPESFYPYTEEMKVMAPPVDLHPEAEKWPSLNHYRVDNGVQGLQASLSVGNFISIGLPFFAKWEDCPKNGILPDVTPKDEIAGGHAMCLFGHFTSDSLTRKLYFICLNSWGPGWGEGGWCYIPASAFNVAKVVGGWDGLFPRLPWK